MFFKKKKRLPDVLPTHIGIIMDGNGRWAKKRGLPRTAGHSSGAKTFQKIARYCNKIGIKYALPEADDAKLIIAGYDEKGKLIALDMQDISVEANSYNDYISEINPDDFHTSKLMIWKMNNLKPLVKSE